MTALFSSYSDKRDTKSLYRTTKEVLGWTRPVQPSVQEEKQEQQK